MRTIDGAHPILNLQLDTPNGVHHAVDISFNGHEVIHKSCMVKESLRGVSHDGKATELCRLVKNWAYTHGLNNTREGFLSSHGWMLLVITYAHSRSSGNASSSPSELGFFQWLQATFTEDMCWVIGAGKPPVEMEEKRWRFEIKINLWKFDWFCALLRVNHEPGSQP